MKIIAFLAVLFLFGAGCTLFTPPKEPQSGEPETSQEAKRPPAIMMTADGKAVAGAEGSYCYGTTCVDKIPPPMLVAELGLGFTAIARKNIVFSVEADIREMSVSLMDASGNAVVGADATLKQRADGKFAYEIPSRIGAGKYYLLAFAQFTAGGDVSYIFPISLK